jgi:TusA-related sulfurtransferase
VQTLTPAITRTVDARGSYCPGPLMELIRAIREGQVGDVIAVYSSDAGSKMDIPKWVEKAGHRLVGVETRDGYDEIVVEKLR